jgi:hypothetical protein
MIDLYINVHLSCEYFGVTNKVTVKFGHLETLLNDLN